MPSSPGNAASQATYRVGLDFRMADSTGIGRYVRGLVPYLTEVDPDLEMVLLVPEDLAPPTPLPPRTQWFLWKDSPEVYSLREQTEFPRLDEMLDEPLDLLHVPHFHGPLLGGAPMVITVHDLTYLHFPEECPSYLHHLYAQGFFRAAVHRARQILTVSRTVQEDLIQTLGVDPSRIQATPLGAPRSRPALSLEARAKRLEGLEVEAPYFLSVGMQRPRKNLRLLLKAFEAVAAEVPHQLVFAGPSWDGDPDWPKVLERSPVRERTRSLGFVSEEDLEALYQGATALVHPSLHEGFGLPLLEAFSAGIPVAAASAGALPEVGQDAALWFDPKDSMALAQCLRTLAKDPDRRAELVSRGRAQLKTFDWEETARGTVASYRKALGKRALPEGAARTEARAE